MLPQMFYFVDKTMNDSDEVWRWVHQKYVMSPIISKLLSIYKYFSYLTVTNNAWLNLQIREFE